jgi:heat shock protein HslJ/membrane-bound inhibitor of C-type lysozyme
MQTNCIKSGDWVHWSRMNTKIIAVGALVVAALGGVVLISSDRIDLAATDPHAHYHDHAATEFVSADGLEKISVVFAGDHVDLTGLGYADMMMQQVEAASGARYENRGANLVLWNKGDEVTLYRGEEVIFSGTHTDHGTEEATHHSDHPTSTDTHDEHTSSHVTSSTGTPVLLGRVWVWEKYQSATGTVVTPITPGTYTLTFAADGNMGATTDCNGFGGTYTLTGNKLEFGSFLSTMMYCEGSQESEFQGYLSSGHLEVSQSGNELILTQEAGGELHFVAQ